MKECLLAGFDCFHLIKKGFKSIRYWSNGALLLTPAGKLSTLGLAPPTGVFQV